MPSVTAVRSTTCDNHRSVNRQVESSKRGNGMSDFNSRSSPALRMRYPSRNSRLAHRTSQNEQPPQPVTPASPQKPIPPTLLKRRLMMSDLSAVMLGYIVAFAVQSALRSVPEETVATQLFLALLSLPIWLAALSINHLYTSRAIYRRSEEIQNILKAGAVSLGAALAFGFMARFHDLSRLWVIAAYVSISVALIGEREIARQVFTKLRQSGRLSRRILLVGTGGSAVALADTFATQPELGYSVVGFVGDQPSSGVGGVRVLGDLSSIEQTALTTEATGVVISLDSVDSESVNLLTRRLTDAGLHVTLNSSLRDIDQSRIRLQQLDGRSMFYIEPTIRNGWRRVAKRAFDVSIAAIVLLLTSPLLLATAIVIRMTSPGPAIFRQQRVGMYGQIFEILKFRTMSVDAEARRGMLLEQNEADGPMFKIRRDPRITKVGRVLRKFSIDEMPQFWNVIRGEMSVVGPRPALPCEVDHWSDGLIDRLRVLPGITGMWQTSGRSDTTFDHYRRLDLYYVDNWSLMHDLRIVLKTAFVVILGRGAS